MSCRQIIKKYIYQCPGSEEGVTYTFSNVNVTGQGVFSGLSGTDAQFKGIASSGATVTVTNDVANKTVNLEVNTAAVVAAIPAGTTAAQGTAQLATDAQAIAKTAANRVLTPSNLAAIGASTTFAGLTRLATVPEAETGTATDIAVTPAGLAAVADAIPTARVFADNAERVAAVPDFVGQIGVQQDTGQFYISNGVIAGNWEAGFLRLGSVNYMTAGTTLDLNSADDFSVTNSDATAAKFVFHDSSTLEIQSFFNFESNGRFQLAGVSVPANSIIITSSTAGQVSSATIANFLSSFNPSSDYIISNGATLRALDVTEGEFTASVAYSQAEIQTLSDALTNTNKVLATLISDIANLDLPVLGV